MELSRLILRQLPRRLCRSNVVGSSRVASITHQQRALSIGFSNIKYNHSGLSQQKNNYRQFSNKHKNGEEEGDEIIGIYGDKPDYEPTTDKSKFTHEVKVEMPDVGELDGGTIETWYKKPGDIIHRDDVICDIRTESFTFGMVTDDDFDSMMGKILVEEESGMVKPGTVIFTTFSEDKHHRDDGNKKDE